MPPRIRSPSANTAASPLPSSRQARWPCSSSYFLAHWCTENPVHCDLYPACLEGYAAIATHPLTLDPFSLRCFRFVVAASFIVSSDLFCPLVSIFAGTSVDAEFRDHRSVNHFPRGQNGSACLEFSACFTTDLAQLFFSSPGFCIWLPQMP